MMNVITVNNKISIVYMNVLDQRDVKCKIILLFLFQQLLMNISIYTRHN